MGMNWLKVAYVWQLMMKSTFQYDQHSS